jgi:hypothetical protein
MPVYTSRLMFAQVQWTLRCWTCVTLLLLLAPALSFNYFTLVTRCVKAAYGKHHTALCTTCGRT